MGTWREGRCAFRVWLIVSALLVFAEQNVLAPNLTAVAKSFGLSTTKAKDKMAATLALWVWLVSAPGALVVGKLADSNIKRSKLLASTLILGGLGALGSALSRTSLELCFSRAIAGVALGGTPPLLWSLLADVFGSDERTRETAVVMTACALGVIFGQSLAGYTGAALGWRFSFFVLSLALGLIAVFVATCLRDPQRRGKDEAGTSSFKRLLKTPTVVLIWLQGVPGCLPLAVVNTYWPDYLHKTQGLRLRDATTVILSFSVAALIGQLAGGEFGQVLYNRVSKGSPAIMCWLTGWARIVPLLVMIQIKNARNWPLPLLASFAAGAGFLSALTSAPLGAMLQNVVPSTGRGAAFAVNAIFGDLSAGGGPFFIAKLETTLGSRRAAYSVTMLGWVLSSAMVAFTFFTAPRDEAQVPQNDDDYPKHNPLVELELCAVDDPLKLVLPSSSEHDDSDFDDDDDTDDDDHHFILPAPDDKLLSP